MASLPTSGRLRFFDTAGDEIPAPLEWTPGFVEVIADHDTWDRINLTVQDLPFSLSLRHVGGRVRIVAEWQRSGPGRYRIRAVGADHTDELVVTIAPRKISSLAFAHLLEDLEARLPAIVALGLQRVGGLAGIALPPPGQSTLAQEVVRLQRAVRGVPGRPGLVRVLTELSLDPHRMLRATEFWVREERARRPHPARLAHALARPHNLTEQGRPARVLDSRVDPTPDVYENRLVLTFTEQVAFRLRRLVRVLAAPQHANLLSEVLGFQRDLARARRVATFLNDVTLPSYLPTQTTMVLLKVPPYRAALEGYLELHRTAAIRLEDLALAAPLENLPRLYQLWGTLQIAAVLLDVAVAAGFRVKAHRLVRHEQEGLVTAIPGGRPLLVLVRPEDGSTVRLTPEMSFGASGDPRSVSYPQIPDVTVEVQSANGNRRLYLFDPKYKLDGESLEGEAPDGKPKKVDIDKMHAYRDAIRDHFDARVVAYAAILYPGPEVRYATGIEAITAYPGADESLRGRVRDVLAEALVG